MHEMWSLANQKLNESQFKRLAKHYPKEFASCWNNLERVFNELNAGKRLRGFKFGFFRSEGLGVYRIGQTGIKSAAELRLYVFPDEMEKTMHILCLGDKNTQQKDIAACHRFMAEKKGANDETKSADGRHAWRTDRQPGRNPG